MRPATCCWIPWSATGSPCAGWGWRRSHRVWIDGTPVSDAYHRDTSQQYGGLIGVHLEEGWNRILIKTNQRSRSVKFQVYLLDQSRAVSPLPPEPRSGPPVLSELAE